MVRVVIADDHPMYREGLRGLLESSPAIEVVGIVATGSDAVDAALDLRPDVILMDLHMPICDGVEATRRIRQQGSSAAVLFLTMLEDDDSVLTAMRSGGQGYILKGADGDEIVRAVHAVASGESIFGAAVAARVLHRMLHEPTSSAPPPLPELSDRERELLDLIARGLDNRAIARRLSISEKTVKNHITNIFVKTGVTTRAEAIVKARKEGLGE